MRHICTLTTTDQNVDWLVRSVAGVRRGKDLLWTFIAIALLGLLRRVCAHDLLWYDVARGGVSMLILQN